MSAITRKQREALKRVYDRCPLYLYDGETYNEPKYWNHPPITYRRFRKMAHDDNLVGCVMVRWLGMWLGIESDGYTHS